MSELIDEKNSYEPHERVVIKTGEDRYQSVLVSDISFAFEQWNNRIEELNRVRELAYHWETMEPPVVHFNPEEQDEFVKNWIIQKGVFRFVAQELKLLLDGEQ